MFCVGVGGGLFALLVIVLIGEARVQKMMMPWMVGSAAVGLCAVVPLIRAYQKESLRGKKILHLSLADLVVASLAAATVSFLTISSRLRAASPRV